MHFEIKKTVCSGGLAHHIFCTWNCVLLHWNCTTPHFRVSKYKLWLLVHYNTHKLVYRNEYFLLYACFTISVSKKKAPFTVSEKITPDIHHPQVAFVKQRPHMGPWIWENSLQVECFLITSTYKKCESQCEGQILQMIMEVKIRVKVVKVKFALTRLTPHCWWTPFSSALFLSPHQWKLKKIVSTVS